MGLCLAPLQAGPDGLWPAAETNPALDAILGRAEGDPAPVAFPRFADGDKVLFFEAHEFFEYAWKADDLDDRDRRF